MSIKRISLTQGDEAYTLCPTSVYSVRPPSMFLEFSFKGGGGVMKMVNDVFYLDIELCTQSLNASQ